MPDVRAAFGTGDTMTIRDTAAEIWTNIGEQDAVFLVTDPAGAVLAALGPDAPASPSPQTQTVHAAAERFPAQSSGFRLEDGALYQTVITPVYVDSNRGAALINVLVASYPVNTRVARQLKAAAGGSDFVFLAGGRTVASSFDRAQPAGLARFSTPLVDFRGRAIGELRILRSFDAARARIDELRRNMIAVWLVAVLAGLAITYFVARRILEPVRALDSAAAEIARGNYDAPLPGPDHPDDELGRLARTFNHMRQSIRAAREELIRRERLSTISRLSTSIVHDLRNPLAAIYGGAEMLVDAELPPPQVKRLAANIYRSSRRVQELLSDLTDVTRGRTRAAEPCSILEIVQAACSAVANDASRHNVHIETAIPAGLSRLLERSRMERVLENLLVNAIDAMPSGGNIVIAARDEGGAVLLQISDTGPGIDPALFPRLFEPFATSGKRRGMGLGLALARQTVRDHSGDLWAAPPDGSGARFFLRL